MATFVKERFSGRSRTLFAEEVEFRLIDPFSISIGFVLIVRIVHRVDAYLARHLVSGRLGRLIPPTRFWHLSGRRCSGFSKEGRKERIWSGFL